MANHTLPTLIRFRREAAGLTVIELANICAVHPSRIYDLEAGQRHQGLSFRLGCKLAVALKLTLDDLAVAAFRESRKKSK